MPRRPELGKKKVSGNVYWHTKAGNPAGVYFGRVDEVAYLDAKRQFADYLQSLNKKRPAAAGDVTNEQLASAFLDWVKANRSPRTYKGHRLHLDRWVYFERGGRLMGDLPALSTTAEDLEAFLDHIRRGDEGDDENPLDGKTVNDHRASVDSAFSWAAGRSRKLRNPSPLLPGDFAPFDGLAPFRRGPRALLEEELPTAEEVKALIDHGDDDLAEVRDSGGRLRRRRPEEFRPAGENPYAGFADMLRVYFYTGARTSELADARVKNVVRRSREILLAKHKRSRTEADPRPRRITLPAEAFEIVARHCAGKRPDDPIFANVAGRPWNDRSVGDRFRKVRERAGVRDIVTIYSFRHLWISEALMSGVDAATVAKMAGTSIAMIEKVYGHFKNEHLLDVANRLGAARSAVIGAIGAA